MLECGNQRGKVWCCHLSWREETVLQARHRAMVAVVVARKPARISSGLPRRVSHYCLLCFKVEGVPTTGIGGNTRTRTTEGEIQKKEGRHG